MAGQAPIVYVVDDDPSVRRSVERLLRSDGFDVQTCATAREFVDGSQDDRPGCLVLDVNLPGSNGLDLQEELARAGLRIPIVFITGHGDIPMSVRAMRAGAVDFLPKPFESDDLLRAVRRAIERDAETRRRFEEIDCIEQRLARLTRREREVFEQVVAGRLNKQVARTLGVTEKTIKVHRARVMEKMEADSLAELVRMAERYEQES